MKKIYALIATVVVLAAASVAVIVNAGKPDSLFEANVEALAQVEDYDSEIWEVYHRNDGGINCTNGGKEKCRRAGEV
ncbi:MAG: hypothetical protein IJZ70_04620 [Bacteroidales bacterium]|nr:hypothetical protein [Bacteroidales bacterium]